ncbi:hypothetical protein SH528x_003006 [Novipirellula sp. SH528]|uniref:hypothetical protein n=1 Tax=Novipirellula sp. SH528 TaxID=3454466 RepID=UPI003FA15AAC
MIQKAFFVLALIVLIAGCNPPHRPNPTKFNVDGGRYYFDIEDVGREFSLNFHSSTSGQQTEEHYEVSWGGDHALTIINGNLTFDGTDLGRLEPRDIIKVTSKSEIFVNGNKREP